MAIEFQSESNSPTGKENHLESMKINEIFLKSIQARVTPLGSPCVPLSVLPDTSNLNTVNATTWKRQVRSTIGTNVIMVDVMGLKRSAYPTGGQPELQEKKKKKDCFSSWFPTSPEPISLLCWNCRGLGNQRTENRLAKLVWAKDPSVVFLADTWIDEAKLILIQDRLKFKHRFIAPGRNKSRGLVTY